MTSGCVTSKRLAEGRSDTGPIIRRLCPAKVNLRLKVLGRRPDGYHELVTVMQPLSLADELILSLVPEGLSLACDAPELPQEEENLVWRAAVAFLEAAGLKLGLRLTLAKRIPLAAGLGGGSSDAAGTLLALNAAAGHPLSHAELHRLASRLGADVPFFLQLRPQMARGIGTDLEPVDLPPFWYVLLNPGFSISTRWVYENLDLTALNKVNREAGDAWKVEELRSWVANDLETVTCRRYPELKDYMQALARQGALAQGMSGSGPTIFGLFPEAEAALQAARALRSGFPGWLAVARGTGRTRYG